MSALDKTPSNPNFAVSSKFLFSVQKTPTVNYFAQKVILPGLRVNSVEQPNPFVAIPKPGDHIEYENLRVTFNVDEDLVNYTEILGWFLGIGFPSTFDQYMQIESQPVGSGLGIFSDISVILLRSTNVANYEFVYEDAFPVTMTELELDTTTETVTYLPLTVGFKYKKFLLRKM
jgi:hypothetical protein